MATSQVAVAMRHCDLDVALTASERQRLVELGEPLRLDVQQLVRLLVHSLLLGAINEDCTIISLLPTPPEPKESAIKVSLHLTEQQLQEVAALSALQLDGQTVDGGVAVAAAAASRLGTLAQVLLQGALMRPQLLAQLLKVVNTQTVRFGEQELQRLRAATLPEAK